MIDFIFCCFFFRQYLAVVFKDKPLELWDIRTCTLLREMSKSFPAITALVSCAHELILLGTDLCGGYLN